MGSWIDPVEIKEVDRVDAQPPQRPFTGAAGMERRTRNALRGLAIFVDPKGKFCAGHDFFPTPFDSAADWIVAIPSFSSASP